MKKNTNLYRLQNPGDAVVMISKTKNRFFQRAGLVAILMYSINSEAQFANIGDVKVSDNTILSVHMDYVNKSSGNFVNDGQVHVFQNWNNDGTVTFTDSQNGKTHFTGASDQIIEGSKTADFKNILFNNTSDLVPFYLAAPITVTGNAEFLKGVVMEEDGHGKMIFKEVAGHTNASDLSFVDGWVEKRGKNAFEFPIGAGAYFRPSYHALGASQDNIYSTKYFYSNSNQLHDHNLKDQEILSINNKEYWFVTQDKGSEKIVLSITIDNDTTPLEFLSPGSDEKVVITRWDELAKKWVNEGGEVSDANRAEPYANLLTSQVKGYGIFTMALVKKEVDIADVKIYNALSPNGDGINDSFLIEGIKNYPDNEVEIYNRWGVKVYEAKSYNENDVMFRGYSDGRATINRGEKLPTGTYFYILKYKKGEKGVEKTGYLYINNQ